MLRYIIGLVVLTSLVQVFASDSTEEDKLVQVNTDLGDIRGSVLKTLLQDRPYYAFRGIRYAKAPVGELRFKVRTLWN